MRSALAALPVISPVPIPAGLSMKRKKRWSGMEVFAKGGQICINECPADALTAAPELDF